MKALKARWLLFASLFPGRLHANKTEDELRAQIIAKDLVLRQADDRNKALSAAVNKQAAEGVKRVVAQDASTQATKTLANIAQAALDDSKTVADEARTRELRAQTNREVETLRIQDLKQAADRNFWAGIFGTIGVVIAGLGNMWTMVKNRVKTEAHEKEVVTKLEKTSADVAVIKAQTNHLTDQLVKATGKEEFRAGVLLGTEIRDQAVKEPKA